MKKKVLSVVLALAMVATMVAGCGNNEANNETNNVVNNAEEVADVVEEVADVVEEVEAPTIAFICKDLSQDWFIGTSSAMDKAIQSRGGNPLVTYDCAMSPDKYMTALDTAITQGVDVLIVCPPDQNLSQVTVDRCAEAGIKVMADDDGLIDENGIHLAPALELDAYFVGLGIGEYLGNYANETYAGEFDTVGYIYLNMPEVSSCVPRATGAVDKFKELVTEFPEDQIFEADYDGTSTKGFDAISAKLTANPTITTWLVTAPNDEGAIGATRALEQAGFADNAAVIAVGGNALIGQELAKEDSCFLATAYIDSALDGQLAGDAAMDWALNDIEAYSEYINEGETFGVYPFAATLVDRTTYENFSFK